MIGRQGLKVTKKSHFPFNVVFFLPGNDISNSVKVFLAFILLYYYFFSHKNLMVLLVPPVLRVPEAPRSADLKFNNTHRGLA